MPDGFLDVAPDKIIKDYMKKENTETSNGSYMTEKLKISGHLQAAMKLKMGHPKSKMWTVSAVFQAQLVNQLFIQAKAYFQAIFFFCHFC